MVLLTSSVVSAYYLFKPTPPSLAQRRQEVTARSPASLPEMKTQNTPEPTLFSLEEIKKAAAFETSLKLDCQDLFIDNNKLSSASVSSDHVILKLSQCKKVFAKAKKVELINKTNGYNASLFKLNKTEFNSDFIQLDKGVNQLVFEISLIDGQKKSQTFKINRIQ